MRCRHCRALTVFLLCLILAAPLAAQPGRAVEVGGVRDLFTAFWQYLAPLRALWGESQAPADPTGSGVTAPAGDPGGETATADPNDGRGTIDPNG